VSTTVVTSDTIHFGDVPAGATQTSTDTFTLQIDRRYPLTNSSLSWTIACTDGTATAVIGIGGGTVSVQNYFGDTFTLRIPPLALDEDTPITISALLNALPSPIAQNIYPGAVLGPSGLVFSLPVTATVTLHQPLVNPGALLFSLKNSIYALPTANQTTLTSQNGIQGEIDHFSPPIVGGLPTESEIASMASKIVSEPYTTPGDLLDRVNALLALAKEAENLHYVDLAEECSYDATTVMENGLATLYATPLPSNPCGQYTLQMQRLLTGIDQLGLQPSVDEPLLHRMCKFSVSPNSLSLYTGESGQVLTANLLDPNGNQRSCTVLNWYSANLNVVGIGPIHNPTSGVIGVGPGVANVSANCDGLLAASAVSVYAGYIGTFTAVGQTSEIGSPCVWNVTWPQTLAVSLSGPNPSLYDMGTLSEASALPCTSASGTVNYMGEALTVSGSTIYATIGQAGQTGGVITITGQVDQTAGTVTGTWRWSAAPFPITGGAQGNFILYATSAPANSTIKP